uniref:PDZ and LIM domain protein 2 n=1 Tax=Malurus cyaneus samueli TaxID=2593467 RepID=A0A8C5TR78_9PASS
MPVTVTVTLPGPAPWGFRISGGRDFRKPITVSKHGKAAAGGLRPGDVIVTINGDPAAEMLNAEAQNKIKQSPGQLRLQVERWDPNKPSLNPKIIHFEPRPLLCTQSDASPAVSGSPCDGGCRGCPLSPVLSPPRWQHPRGHRRTCPGMFCSSWQRRQPGEAKPGSEPAMRRLEEDSEVYKMLQENRELRAAPRQSSTFRLLQEALEDEEGGERDARGPVPVIAPGGDKTGGAGARAGPVPAVTPDRVKIGVVPGTQAVRIQDGRYRHPSCYTCADCGLSLKMRGHFWVGDELFCEKHARLRYQGPPGGPVPRPVSPRS